MTTTRRKRPRWLRPAVAAVLVGAAGSAHALAVSELQPKTVEELKRAGLVGAQAPVPAFRWGYVNKRPMRGERTVQESFEAGPQGLSPTAREIHYPDGKIENSDAISARGLARVHPGDASMDAHVEGLTVPPKSGDRFSITVVRDGTTIIERCSVGEPVAAKTLLADLPGRMFNIECRGEATYFGMQVKADSKVVYLEDLGVFFSLSDVLSTPFGRFENANRLTEFQFVDP